MAKIRKTAMMFSTVTLSMLAAYSSANAETTHEFLCGWVEQCIRVTLPW